MKTRILSLFLAALALSTALSLSACNKDDATNGNGDGSSVTIADNVAVADLCTAVDALLENSSDFATMTDSYINGMMKIDPSEFADYAVKLRASGANIDEYGIFKAKDKDSVEAVKKIVEDYLKMRVDTWMPEYMPEEFPKMENASVKVIGNYVVYCILDEDTTAGVFAAVEDKLTEK